MGMGYWEEDNASNKKRQCSWSGGEEGREASTKVSQIDGTCIKYLLAV